MSGNEALAALLAAITPFVVIWLRARTRKLVDEMDETPTQPQRTPVSSPNVYLTKTLEDAIRKTAELTQQLDSAMKTLEQYRRNEEALIDRVATSNVELRIIQMERDKLYEHIYSQVNLKIGQPG